MQFCWKQPGSRLQWTLKIRTSFVTFFKLSLFTKLELRFFFRVHDCLFIRVVLGFVFVFCVTRQQEKGKGKNQNNETVIASHKYMLLNKSRFACTHTRTPTHMFCLTELKKSTHPHRHRVARKNRFKNRLFWQHFAMSLIAVGLVGEQNVEKFYA